MIYFAMNSTEKTMILHVKVNWKHKKEIFYASLVFDKIDFKNLLSIYV